jgi:hypothetical protein
MIRKALGDNGSGQVVGSAGDLAPYANHSAAQPLSLPRDSMLLSAHLGVGAGGHTRSTGPRDDQLTHQRRTSARRVDPSRQGGSRRRPSTGPRPGRPPRHQRDRTTTSGRDQQSRTNTALPQPLPTTTLDAAGCVSPTPQWHSTIRQHLYVTAAILGTASARPPHQTPLTAHIDQRGDQRDASRGGTPSPRRHPQRRMVEAATFSGCNANVLG